MIMRTKTELEIHPAAGLFPGMTAEEYSGLLESIRQHGQQDSIKLLDGQVLDGRHRLRACLELGIDPELEELPTDTDAVQYSIASNLHRRSLTTSQRAIAAAKSIEMYEEQARNRMTSGGVANLPQGQKGKSRDQAGDAFGVSGKSVDAAKTVLTNGADALIDLVDSGQVAISAAALVAKHLSQDDQKKLAAGGSKAVKAKSAELRKSATGKKATDTLTVDRVEREMSDAIRNVKKYLAILEKHNELTDGMPSVTFKCPGYKPHRLLAKFEMCEIGQMDLLVDSIKLIGQMEPIVIVPGDCPIIVDGRARLMACREIGVEPLYREIADDESDIAFELLKGNHDRIFELDPDALLEITRIADDIDASDQQLNRDSNLFKFTPRQRDFVSKRINEISLAKTERNRRNRLAAKAKKAKRKASRSR